jgi:hypothetical protein
MRILMILLVTLFCVASADADSIPTYKWTLTNPQQLAAFRTKAGILTVAEVHLSDGCQRGFIIPTKTKFGYVIKVRTEQAAACIMVDQHVLISFLEKGDTQIVHVKTATGTQDVTVANPPTPAPVP